MRRTTGVVVTAVLIGLGVSGCSASVGVSQEKLEEDTMEGLEEIAGQRPDEVSCNGGLEGVVGDTQRCQLTAGPDELGYTVTVTDVQEEDDWINYEIEVDEFEDTPVAP